jgi:pyruvate, water dikinase
MAEFWRKLFGGLAVGSAGRSRPSIKARFASFQAVSAANDAFLKTLSEIVDSAGSFGAAAGGGVRESCDSLCESAAVMVRSLVAMSGGRYQDLPARLEALEREVRMVIPRTGPLEAGAFVIWPEDPDAARPEVVGGKAAGLSRLAGVAGVRVPPFFVISAAAHKRFLSDADLSGRVSEVLRHETQQDSPSLRSLCDGACREIMDAQIPADLMSAISAAYARLRGLSELTFGVAVRSSAVMEDSASSFAGQFETVLGVKQADILSAYKRVIASQCSFQAVQYARLSGSVDEDIAMSVIVMAMVQPTASGVAYSRVPDLDGGILVTAVPGLAEVLMDGRVIPERLLVTRDEPHRVLERKRGGASPISRCDIGGGLIVDSTPETTGATLELDADLAIAVARVARKLEEHCGGPQDVEWAIDHQRTLFVVQSRRLRGHEERRDIPPSVPAVDGYRVLVSGATRACGGVACGPVVRIADLDELDAVTKGAVLVAPATSPRLSSVMERVAAIVTEAGSPTGHMATVAREFGIPTLVGAVAAMSNLKAGARVTVDAWSGNVYDGEVAALLPGGVRGERTVSPPFSPAKNRLKRLVDRVAPLSLKDPRSPEFSVGNCRTLHDVARFVHQKAMAEMFGVDGPSHAERGSTRRLKWRVPMEVVVLDLGGGLSETAGSFVETQEIQSTPLLALIEGMTDPRLRWAGPVGFDLKGFMSVVVRSAADDQRYGEPGFAICSREYAQFNSRLAYHFSAVDAMCSASVNRNYVRFAFFGGAAIAQRREYRAHFLGTVLKCHGYDVNRSGDRVEAVLGKRSFEATEESLVMVGRLLVSARHLDMVIESQAIAEAYAQAFLSGDFCFEFAHRGSG